MDHSKDSAVLVLGMHRSGTSCMAGLLNILGLYTGPKSTIIPSDENNPKGYFEDTSVVSCNDKLLATDSIKNLALKEIKIGIDNKHFIESFSWLFESWNSFSADSSDRFDSSINSAIRAFMLDKPTDAIPVIKDPRLCLTLPLWLRIVNVKSVIFMVRNPVSVAESLYKRDSIPFQTSFDVWFNYNQHCLNNIKSLPYKIVNYDSLLSDKESTIKNVCSFLNLNQNGLDEKIDQAKNFITSDLNRSTSLSDNSCSNEISKAFNDLVEKNTLSNYPNYSQKVLSARWEQAYYAAYSAFNLKINQLTVEMANAELERINKHPISGPLIKLLRILKNDPDFGKLKTSMRNY